MKQGTWIATLAVCAAFSSTAMAGTPATFDFNDIPALSWWLNQFPATTNNGLVMASSGRVFGSVGTGDGVALKPAYSQDSEAGIFSVKTLEEGVGTDFSVQSIDISAYEGNPAEITPTVEGKLGGVTVWSITPTTSVDGATWYTYTAADTGDMSADIDEIVWNTGVHSDPNSTFGNSIDNISIIANIEPGTVIYPWTLGGFWAPHSVFDWNTGSTDLLHMGLEPYWWAGDGTYGAVGIQHRPGLADLPAGGGFGGAVDDTFVGGFGWRGIYAVNPAPVIAVGETLKVSYDATLFSSGTDGNRRIVDSLFSPYATSGINYLGGEYDSWSDDLGFAIWLQTNGTLAVVLDPANENLISPAALSIDLADLGMTSLTNGAETDALNVTYTAEKTSAPGTWSCTLTVLNRETGTDFGVTNVAVSCSTVYNTASYYIMSTADDLSLGDTTSGNGGLGGYEIDNLDVRYLDAVTTLTGYEAFVDAHELVYGDPDTLEFDDYDSDTLLNIYEYGYNGDMTNGMVSPAILPELVVSNGIAYYSVIQLKDSLSGIIYTLESTDNLKDTGFTSGPWDVTDTDSDYDPLFTKYTVGKNDDGLEFFKTTITTNSP